MELTAQPLTPAAFAPFGAVLDAPRDPGRRYVEDCLDNRRAGASLSLSLSRIAPLARLPLRIDALERHEFSSQTFLPLAVSRYLVVVAPAAAGGGPDGTRALAFLAQPGQGITYHPGTWHYGMTVLDRDGEFAVLMWRDGGAGDEEFVALKTPLTVTIPTA